MVPPIEYRIQVGDRVAIWVDAKNIVLGLRINEGPLIITPHALDVPDNVIVVVDESSPTSDR